MISPLAMLLTMLAIGGAIFAAVVYKKHFAGEESEEGFETEKRRKPREKFEAEKDKDDGDDIVEVAAAFRRAKGTNPTTDQVREIMKIMRRTGETAQEVIDRFEEEEEEEDKPPPPPPTKPKPDDDHKPKPNPKPIPAPPPSKPAAPMMDAMEASVLRRIEDELESVVNRIDGLLEEIQAVKGRRISGPLTEETVESFVPYHPV